jgi:hypothetical protein
MMPYRWAALACFLCACSTGGLGRTDSEEDDWPLAQCASDEGCPGDLACVCGHCEYRCESGDVCAVGSCVSDDTVLAGRCEGTTPPSGGLCLLACSTVADCSENPNATACVEGYCQGPTDTSSAGDTGIEGDPVQDAFDELGPEPDAQADPIPVPDADPADATDATSESDTDSDTPDIDTTADARDAADVPELVCTVTPLQPIGEFGVEYDAITDCICDAVAVDCRTLYRSRVVSLDGNTVVVEGTKVLANSGNPTPSAPVSIWLVEAPPEGGQCLALDDYPARAESTWSADATWQLEGSVWPTLEAFEAAPNGSEIWLTVVSGSGTNPDVQVQRIFYGRDPLGFRKECR